MAYNPIKRLKSWFFQDNIPTELRTYTDGNGQTINKQVKTRFAKGHFPKEEVFKDLLETSFLKSAGNDLQDVASTDDIYNASDVEKVVKPNQLPILEQDIAGGGGINSSSTTTDPYTGSVFEPKSRNDGGKKKWSYYFTTEFAIWLFARFVPKGGTTGQILRKNSNTDYDVRWENLPTNTNGLPAGGTTNQYLRKINNTDYNVEWANKDWYTQAEVTTFLNTETNNRTLLDNHITNNNVSLVPLSFYTTHNLELFKTRIDNADSVNATQNTNISNNTSAINNIINGASLPASSLFNLQQQINALSPTNLNQTYTVVISDEVRVLSNSIWYSKIGNRVFLSSYSVVKPATASVWALNEPITYTTNLPTVARPHTTTSEISSVVQIEKLGVWITTYMTIFNNGLVRIYAPTGFTFDDQCNIYIPTVSYLTN